MKLIDVRQTPYGKVADVQLETAALSFSMPYAEYALLEKCGMLDNDGMAIESNIRFMTLIHEARIPYPLELPKSVTWQEAMTKRDEDFNRRYYNNQDGKPEWKYTKQARKISDLDDGFDDAVIGGVER